MPRTQRIGVPHRLDDETLRQRDRLPHRQSAGEEGREGRGHGVAAAVGVAGGEPRSGQFGEGVTVVVQVDADVAVLSSVPICAIAEPTVALRVAVRVAVVVAVVLPLPCVAVVTTADTPPQIVPLCLPPFMPPASLLMA